MNEITLVAAVRRALQEEIAVIVKEESEKAARLVETRVREKTAQVACRILDHMTMESRGPELVIRVDFSKPQS